MSYKAVLFDLDGTLVDTLADLSNAMNYGLTQLGQPVHSMEECRKMIGNGVRKFAQRALGPDKQGLVDELLTLMRGYYRENCTRETAVYEGIGDLLDQLSKIGIGMAVVTNKDEDVAKVVVNHYFASRYFEQIAGASNGVAIKPDTSVTLRILESLGAAPQEALFVGDSDVDILTAAACGITSVGVSWGFRDSDALKAAGADKVVDTPAEILQLLT